MRESSTRIDPLRPRHPHRRRGHPGHLLRAQRLAAADRQIAQAKGLDAKTGPWRRRRPGR
ncbi:hypothetical protein ACFY5K_24770 [Streptomyces griseofuscus]|uniref:hypothetical protein n=1 Tax=Streptomyces griseofuscus TaxID=146922 RepID=UPI0036BD4F41